MTSPTKMVTLAVGVRALGYPTNRRQQVEFIALLCLVVPIGCRVKNPLGPINKERSAIVFKEQLRVFVLSLIWVRHTDGPPHLSEQRYVFRDSKKIKRGVTKTGVLSFRSRTRTDAVATDSRGGDPLSTEITCAPCCSLQTTDLSPGAR